MRRIRLMVVGPPPFLSPVVRRAWDEAGIDLQGPVSPSELGAALSGAPLDGAVVDLNYDAPALLSVVETFDALNIPALFASVAPDIRGGFTFSTDPASINAIVLQLMGVNQTTLQ
ncbi:MAG: hypothetical protein ACK4QP_15480 [Pseudorhizobium sp.]